MLFFSCMEEAQARALLTRLVDDGYMPAWARTAACITVRGGRPTARELRQLGVVPDYTLLVDGQAVALPHEQFLRLLQVPEFKATFTEKGTVLMDLQGCLQPMVPDEACCMRPTGGDHGTT